LSESTNLRRRIVDVGAAAGAESLAVALYDYRTHETWEYQGERWFHAASTIKVPVLLGVFAAIEEGRFKTSSRVHVRNRFLSVVDGRPYRIDAARDSNQDVHAQVGRTLQVGELAQHMIVTSSNLATNLLIDLVGLPQIQETMKRFGLHGIELVRGVEDLTAWEHGINNRVTADGLLGALRLLEEDRHFAPDVRGEMLWILHAQEFRSGIPAGLPDDARVAHKTGEISTMAHDAGIVYLPDREPYVLVVLTEWDRDVSGRKQAIASVSRVVYEHVTEGDRAHA
jgi:beta-lactamase class A